MDFSGNAVLPTSAIRNEPVNGLHNKGHWSEKPDPKVVPIYDSPEKSHWLAMVFYLR